MSLKTEKRNARIAREWLTLVLALLFSGAVAPANDFADQRAAVSALAKLTTPPAMAEADGFDSTKSLKAIYYDVLPWKGTPTKAFAWLGMPDHVHLAVQLGRTISVAELVKVVKQTSSGWIKREGRNHAGFAWQAGYGAFSVGASQLPDLIEYVEKQEEHHRARGFQEEYRGFLKRYAVEYDERYVWD